MANPQQLRSGSLGMSWEEGEYREYAEIWELITQSYNTNTDQVLNAIRVWIFMFTNADITGGGGMSWLYGGYYC